MSTQTTEQSPDVAASTGYKLGQQSAFAEAANLLELSPAELRLHCGEKTAQEMRTVRAVLRWKADEMRDRSRE